ncbi:MAG: bifunctional glutamate N-acetyltransferase/amino-acid acetyltransferase ArgJ [Thermodesulfobacteriota bacterium]|nr:bifunctional glutamate N-acetyltransferase/amino-acid acetyltransferase ArgJ [Thermodesulfobacteriota bacterium]
MMNSVPGFLASGISSGIKSDNSKDLGLIFSEKPATAVGLFTTNQMKAAPVILTQEKIKNGLAQALIVNSGNANACTGKLGFQHATSLSEQVARELKIDNRLVMVSSTGIIGVPLPIERINTHLHRLVASLSSTGLTDFSEAIMTTDTFSKTILRKASIAGKDVTLCGIAKGSGMIMPAMATLLAYFLTDLSIERSLLEELFREIIHSSFNALTIDGETSTNDTAIILANGFAGNEILRGDTNEITQFKNLLKGVAEDLSRLILKDAEGSTKIVQIAVKNALTREEAQKIAYKVANSVLVKTAFFGEDPNWGRIMSAIGQAGAAINPAKIAIWFNDVMVAQDSSCTGNIKGAQDILKLPEFRVTIDLQSGTACADIATTDLTIEYVKINSDYPT